MMILQPLLTSLIAVGLLNGNADRAALKVTAPPVHLKLDPFYKKYVSADGYPVVASEKVSDFALKEAAYLVRLMLAKRPDVREAMVRSGSRMIVMAYNEFTTDVPEHAHLRPKDYWDARARGLGGSRRDPVCSCGEENLLGYPGDPYAAECILIHEFAHNIHLRGMVRIDSTFDRRLERAYQAAMKKGLWKGKYASVNHHEYFAEGVQSWFDNNRPPDHDHNHVDTRQELIEYDPALAALCREVFGDTQLVYTRPETRLRGHLAGYRPDTAPKFRWPKRLNTVRQEIREKAQRRELEGLSPEKLLILGDKRADEKDYAGALTLYKQAYDHFVPKLRKRKFLKPVRARLMTRDQLKKHMRKLIDEEVTPQELRLSEAAYKAFGMAPKTLDLKKTVVDLHTEEVAGFYNPKNKDLVLIKEVEQPKKKPGFFAWLLGQGEAFDKEEQKITLAHEMTHALQDQHFDLQAMDQAVKHDDDMAYAYQALVEGDATLLMFLEMERESGDTEQALKTPPQVYSMAFSLIKFVMPFAAGKTYRKAPRILRESLIFPYHRGLVFVAHLTNRGGWKKVDQAFAHPPLSTEQILHPAKYFEAGRDDPVQIELPALEKALGAAGQKWQKIGQNVLGEFQIRIMLAGQSSGRRAAAGWDGDAYVLFENEQKQLGLVWVSTWDTPQDAQELVSAYARHVRRGQGVAEEIDDEQSSVTWESEGIGYHIERRGQDVAVVQGFEKEATNKLVELGLKSKKRAKVFRKKGKNQTER